MGFGAESMARAIAPAWLVVGSGAGRAGMVGAWAGPALHRAVP
ncbi:hypothetical protein [Nocardia rhamnosiphila]